MIVFSLTWNRQKCREWLNSAFENQKAYLSKLQHKMYAV